MERSSTHTTVQGASVMQVPEGSWPSGQCEPGVWKGRTDDGRRHAKYRAAWGHLSGPLRLDNPYEMDRPPSQYPDEGTLVALLHHWEIDTRSIQQVIATVRGGGMAVLPIRFTAVQLQAAFSLNVPHVCAWMQGAKAARRALLLAEKYTKQPSGCAPPGPRMPLSVAA